VDDPALAAFLRLLDRDMAEHPERLSGIPAALYRQILELTEGIEYDPDEPIVGPVAL
jgi:antitoxin PrlF